MARVRYVYEGALTKRFTDPDLVQVLRIMRTPGGAPLPQRLWQRIVDTEVKTTSGAVQPGQVSSETAADPRLKDTLDWYQASYFWPIAYLTAQQRAVQTARKAQQVLFYIPAIDRPDQHLPKCAFREMSAVGNMSTTKKLMSVFLNDFWFVKSYVN